MLAALILTVAVLVVVIAILFGIIALGPAHIQRSLDRHFDTTQPPSSGDRTDGQ